jgi:hypothetical protein
MLQFVREIPISVTIQKTLSHRRGFLFHVAAGFAGNVDAESGMIVNLVYVDQWLQDLKAQLEAQTFATESESLNEVFAAVHSEAAQFLQTRVRKFGQGLKLSQLTFREERGFGFSSYLVPVNSPQDLEFFNTQYLELVPPASEEAVSKLIKIKTHWQHHKGSPADYAHESFKLLKPLMQLNADELLEPLAQIKNHTLESGSRLARIEVVDIAKNVTLEI